MKQRLDNLRARMAAEDVDLVVLGAGAHLGWLLGLKPHADERPFLFCVSADGAGFLMPALEAAAVRQHTDLPFFPWTDEEGPQAAFNELLSALNAANARSIALDETMRADFAALVTDNLLNAQRQFSASTLGALRMRKDDDEYHRLKANAESADNALRFAWSEMRPGMTELEVANIVREHFAAKNVMPMFNIIGSGPNGAFPHHQSGDRVLGRGDAVVMDIGGTMNGMFSDITRMAVIGEEPEGFSDVHAVVDRAVEAALAAARPGVPAHEVDAAARGVIDAAGYGPYFTHRTGHGLGTEVHEPPYITATSQTVLDEGMVFSIEPGIYLPGRFGLRLEEIVILRADGPEILSDLPRDAVCIQG